ncbi:MAG: ABC transporter substrate-binding protein, partial [Chloroflexota bacterium]
MTHLKTTARSLSMALVATLVLAGCAPSAAPSAPASAPAQPPATAATAAPPTPTPPIQTLPRIETPTPAAARPGPATPTPASAEKPRYGGILTAYESSEPTSLDVNQETTIFTLQNQTSVYNGLLEVDPTRLPDRVITGDLAEKWSASPDGKTWTFTLKSGVTFHDGKPLTSADVAFTLDRMKTGPGKIKTPFKELFEAVNKVETPDAQTARVVLNRPLTYFAILIANPALSIMPKHILEKDQNALEQKSLGSGPFMFKAWNKNVSIELARNPNYFKKGLPYLDGIRWITLREPATQIAALRTGRVVFGGHGTRGLSKREADLLEKDIPGVQISRYSTDSEQYLLVNTRKKPLDDIRV